MWPTATPAPSPSPMQTARLWPTSGHPRWPTTSPLAKTAQSLPLINRAAYWKPILTKSSAFPRANKLAIKTRRAGRALRIRPSFYSRRVVADAVTGSDKRQNILNIDMQSCAFGHHAGRHPVHIGQYLRGNGIAGGAIGLY